MRYEYHTMPSEVMLSPGAHAPNRQWHSSERLPPCEVVRGALSPSRGQILAQVHTVLTLAILPVEDLEYH